MTALEIADFIGIVSFTISGFLIAVHMKLDILGIFISAFLTAFGGGMVRDVVANKTPFIFTHTLPITLVFATLIISIVFKLHRITDLEGKTAFVTGGAGGIGAAICARFVAEGARVVAADLQNPGKLAPGVEFVEFDVTREDLVTATFSELEGRRTQRASPANAFVVVKAVVKT